MASVSRDWGKLRVIFCCCVNSLSWKHSEILERSQSKTLHMILDAPWYVPNTVIRRDLQSPTDKEEIRRYSSQYSARLSAYGATRQQAIENTPAKWSAYKIRSTIVVTDPYGCIFYNSRPRPLIFLRSSSTIVFTTLSGPRSRPTTPQKI
jgi:hypothetical protein